MARQSSKPSTLAPSSTSTPTRRAREAKLRRVSEQFDARLLAWALLGKEPRIAELQQARTHLFVA